MGITLSEMDHIDKQIVQLVQQKPNLTHTKIAKQINRSQPTVGLRIRKLEQAGILKFQAGINLKATDLHFARIDIEAKNPSEIMELVKNCPYMVNAFRMSGKLNVSVIVTNPTMEGLEKILNFHFRTNPEVNIAYMEIITEISKDYVLHLDFDEDTCKCCKFEKECH